jgi:hypothetical protein
MRRACLAAQSILAACLFCTPGAAWTATARAATSAAAVRVSHDGFTAHAEPSLAVDPRNPRILLGAAMLLQGHHVVVGTFSSADGGATWRDRGPLPMPRGTTYSGDATVAFDARGTGFVACLVQTAVDDGVYVWRTSDGGHTFQRPEAAMRGSFADHPGIAIGDAGRRSVNATIYVAWRTRTGIEFSQSIDGARHFGAASTLVPGAELYMPVIAVGPGGAVAIAYEVLTGGTNGHVAVVSSHDYGRHFARPVLLGGTVDTLTPAPGLRLPTGPSIAIAGSDGAIYVAYVDDRAAHPGIALARLRAGAPVSSVALSIPIAVPGATLLFQPHIAVAGAGLVAVSSFALARDRIAELLTLVPTVGSGTPSTMLIGGAFDPALGVLSAGKGKDGSSWWIGDYQGLAVGGGVAHPFWNDTRTGRLEICTAAIPIPVRQ